MISILWLVIMVPILSHSVAMFSRRKASFGTLGRRDWRCGRTDVGGHSSIRWFQEGCRCGRRSGDQSIFKIDQVANIDRSRSGERFIFGDQQASFICAGRWVKSQRVYVSPNWPSKPRTPAEKDRRCTVLN